MSGAALSPGCAQGTSGFVQLEVVLPHVSYSNSYFLKKVGAHFCCQGKEPHCLMQESSLCCVCVTIALPGAMRSSAGWHSTVCLSPPPSAWFLTLRPRTCQLPPCSQSRNSPSQGPCPQFPPSKPLDKPDLTGGVLGGGTQAL